MTYWITLTDDQWQELLSHLDTYPQAAKKIREELDGQESAWKTVEAPEKSWRRVIAALPGECGLRDVINRQIKAVRDASIWELNVN